MGQLVLASPRFLSTRCPSGGCLQRIGVVFKAKPARVYDLFGIHLGKRTDGIHGPPAGAYEDKHPLILRERGRQKLGERRLLGSLAAPTSQDWLIETEISGGLLGAMFGRGSGSLFDGVLDPLAKRANGIPHQAIAQHQIWRRFST
jgi:hypothetical protein